MNPRMSEKELRLFECFTRCSDRYLEFGSGGSTCVAANTVNTSIVSIDSSKEWQDNVRKYCTNNNTKLIPELLHADIGPTGNWGVPTDKNTRDKWPNYHGNIWTTPSASCADLFMVDGRFRIACFVQIVLHCEPDSVIMFHDFTSREKYHVIKEVAREIASAEELSVFTLARGRIRNRALEILYQASERSTHRGLGIGPGL